MTQPINLPNEKLRVLIADDVQATRRSTRMMLAINPDVVVVAMATDGIQAVEMTRRHHPDIAIMDIRMPKLDGLSAIEQMIDIQPDLACIIISAQKESEILRKAMSIGAREYLIKPFTVDELNMAVHRVGKIVRENRLRNAHADRLRKQREAYLKRLAHEYARSRRTDDQAVEVFEALARNPKCELRWLMNLAMIYVIRREWRKLKLLAARIEQQERARGNNAGSR
jgi:YesN/AraC family two-component response regulator